jgi:hypothetical protein
MSEQGTGSVCVAIPVELLERLLDLAADSRTTPAHYPDTIEAALALLPPTEKDEG